MTKAAAELGSGKGHRDENFPVASLLIHPRHRDAILTFYRFARAADDVADHPTASPDRKLHLLDHMRRTILGEADVCAEALALRRQMDARKLSAQHALDLLEAFRRDVTKLRYRDWDDLMDYCRVSAMPVGRFVLDVHGEARSTWPASDALCAALQIINHLQDCGKDYRTLDRVYIPTSAFSAAGIGPEALGETQASPALRGIVTGLAGLTTDLLMRSRVFAGQIHDRRLALEVSVIQALAENLCGRLAVRDSLSMRVHHSKAEALALSLGAGWRFFRAKRGPGEAAIAEERR